MKYLKVFSLFIIFHVTAWAGAHTYFNSNKEQILIVVDTSYSMKQKFPEIKQWIEDYESSARYKNIMIGTDKAMLGKLSELRRKEEIFRTAFGIMKEDNLKRYLNQKGKKILLSDGVIAPEGWEIVDF
ncbi:hypothetical protein [uncultured Cocleimonas sp.]|uniref:hypothetical protein n=1 Tax=uncultured Cocleimonas sp. TaxID=1051587 RepID=UPI0026041116|nr:hypothetical protein [uncultured Cocleimonas sp.]